MALLHCAVYDMLKRYLALQNSCEPAAQVMGHGTYLMRQSRQQEMNTSANVMPAMNTQRELQEPPKPRPHSRASLVKFD